MASDSNKMHKWTVDKVVQYMKEIRNQSTKKCIDNIIKKDIDGKKLLSLKWNDLSDLGLSQHEVKHILSQIKLNKPKWMSLEPISNFHSVSNPVLFNNEEFILICNEWETNEIKVGKYNTYYDSISSIMTYPKKYVAWG
eukprot:228638_1